MSTSRDRQFRVWKAPLTGAYFAGWAVHEGNGRWRVLGQRHDVTEDVRRIIREAENDQDSDGRPDDDDYIRNEALHRTHPYDGGRP